MREINLIKTACGGCLEVAGMQRLQSADPGINQKIGEITGYLFAKQKKARKPKRKTAPRNGNLDKNVGWLNEWPQLSRGKC